MRPSLPLMLALAGCVPVTPYETDWIGTLDSAGACGEAVPSLLGASLIGYDGEDGPVVNVSLMAEDADGALHWMGVELWVDDELDGAVDTSDPADWLVELDLFESETMGEVERCEVTGGFPVILRREVGDLFPADTWVELELVLTDADGFVSEPVLFSGCTAVLDEDGDCG